MSAKDRLCTHCGTFIADDDAVRPCVEGGYAHAGCEHTNWGDWHEPVAPTKQDRIDLDRMVRDEELEVEDHR